MTDLRISVVPARIAGRVRRAVLLTAAAAGAVIGWQADGYAWWLLLVAAMTAGLAQQTLP